MDNLQKKRPYSGIISPLNQQRIKGLLMQYPLTDEQIKEQEILKQQLSQFKNPKPLTDDLTSQLVRESALTSGLYRPSDVFRNANSIAITLKGAPIILLGWEGENNSTVLAERLLNNSEFINLVKHEYGHTEDIGSAVVSNNAVCPGTEYLCLAESKQGVIDDGEDGCAVVSILPHNNHAFAFGLCINSSIMLCFCPDAKPLSKQVILGDD